MIKEKEIEEALIKACGDDINLTNACLEILHLERDAEKEKMPEDERLAKVRKILEDKVDESERNN